MTTPPLSVRPATLAEILALRHAVLRPGRPLETAHFDGDDDPASVHLAAVLDATGEVVGCATLMPRPYERRAAWQLRGMATRADLARRGIGRGGAARRRARRARPRRPAAVVVQRAAGGGAVLRAAADGGSCRRSSTSRASVRTTSWCGSWSPSARIDGQGWACTATASAVIEPRRTTAARHDTRARGGGLTPAATKTRSPNGGRCFRSAWQRGATQGDVGRADCIESPRAGRAGARPSIR